MKNSNSKELTGCTDREAEKRIVYKASTVSIIVNFVLVIIKAIAGIWGHSKALVSDAIHSLSDIFSTIVVIIGYKLSRKEDDDDHPYGHERIECVAAVILASMLALTGGMLGYNSIMDIYNNNFSAAKAPGVLTIYAAFLSIVIKEAMYWYTRHAANQVSSDALMADAWHHRSDALSSIGSLVGVLWARNGFPAADAIAGIIICILILKAAFDIYHDAFQKMVDHSCDSESRCKYREEILKVEGVRGIHTLKTRMFGAKVYMDIEIYMDGSLTLFEAHDIAEKVHDQIEKTFPEVKHCMVHFEPKEQAEADMENQLKADIEKLNNSQTK